MNHDHESESGATSRGQHRSFRRGNTQSVVLLLVGALLVAAPVLGEDIVRADFLDPEPDGNGNFHVFLHPEADLDAARTGVFADGANTFSACLGDEPPLLVYDYVDRRDECTDVSRNSPSVDNVGSGLSGGGRWHLKTEAKRAVRLHIGLPTSSIGGECAALAALPSGPGVVCGCETTCDVRLWISADRLFKKKASRQSLGGRFDVFPADASPPSWRVNWIDPLYLCPAPAPNDKDSSWRVLQSIDCFSDPSTDVSEAEIVDTSTNVVIGTWNLPIRILAQRVALPGSDEDPGSDVCVGNGTLPQGADCTNDVDACCSGKCKGRITSKKCK